MQEVRRFLQKKYVRGFIITTEFKDGDEFICPNFISEYRFITRTIIGKDANGHPKYGDIDESIPWISNPNT